MSAQRYSSSVARERMGRGECPECGETPAAHSNDPRFWIPRSCDLLERGVTERVAQYQSDLAETS